MDIRKYRTLHTNEIISALESKKICNFITSSDTLNIVPMLYVFDYDNDNFTFYFININKDKIIHNINNLEKIYISIENSILGFYIDAYQLITTCGTSEIINDTNEQNSILLKFKKRYLSYFNDIDCSHCEYIKVSTDSIIGKQY